MITAVDGESILDMSAADASNLLSGKLNSSVTVTVHRGEGANAKTITGVPNFLILRTVNSLDCIPTGMPVYICKVLYMRCLSLSV